MNLEDLLDETTMDFVQLWDYAQTLPNMQNVFSPDDIVLLDEMVNAQNFAIAFDLLCHRLKPHSSYYPDEIRDLLRGCHHGGHHKKQRTISVQPPPEYLREPTLEEFRAQHFPASKLIGLPPPPNSSRVSDDPFPEFSPDDNEWDVDEDLLAQQFLDEEEELKQLENDRQRRELREQQDMDYIQSLIADSELVCQQSFPDDLSARRDDDNVKEENITVSPILSISPALEMSGPGTVRVLVVLPDRRLEISVNPNQTRVKNIARWIYDQTETHYETFFTNFPKVEWDSETLISDLPIERNRLMLMVSE